jgi:hypothetical protein
VWVELVAYQGGAEIYRSELPVDGAPDPQLWSIWSTLLTEEGEATHSFWEAADITGDLLPVQTTTDPNDPNFVFTHISHDWLITGSPDRVTMAVKITPVGAEILAELVASGDLDPAIAAEMPTFTLGPTVLEWTPDAPVNASGLSCVPTAPPASPVGTN